MRRIPEELLCFSWNVQQRTTASLRTSESGVRYNDYVVAATIGFIEEGEGVATFIGLQGLSTIAFKQLQSRLTTQYDDRVLCHFTPHSMSQKEWDINYEKDNTNNGMQNEMAWFGNMAIYFIGLDADGISCTGSSVECNSYELAGGSSAMPCINIKHKDGSSLHLICVHLAKTDTLQAEQQVQLSQVLCQTRADLTILAGVINAQDCILPGYNSSIQANAANSYPSKQATIASSDVWAINDMCNTMSVEHGPASTHRLLHIEEISNHLPISRMIKLVNVPNARQPFKFSCSIN